MFEIFFHFYAHKSFVISLQELFLEAMNEQDFGIKEIISHAKEYGFVYPSSEICGAIIIVQILHLKMLPLNK